MSSFPPIQKYVCLPGDEIIIFSRKISHIVFSSLNPVSAGYCEISANDAIVECYGRSDSLGLDADRKKDSLHATLQLFGADGINPDP